MKKYILLTLLIIPKILTPTNILFETYKTIQTDELLDISTIDKLLSYAYQEIEDLEEQWDDLDRKLAKQIELLPIADRHKLLKESEPQFDDIEKKIEDIEKLVAQLHQKKIELLAPPPPEIIEIIEPETQNNLDDTQNEEPSEEVEIAEETVEEVTQIDLLHKPKIEENEIVQETEKHVLQVPVENQQKKSRAPRVTLRTRMRFNPQNSRPSPPLERLNPPRHITGYAPARPFMPSTTQRRQQIITSPTTSGKLRRYKKQITSQEPPKKPR